MPEQSSTQHLPSSRPVSAIRYDLETARMCLRQFTTDDLDDVARLFANPDVMRFMGLAGEPLDRADSETALLSIIAHWNREGFGRWAVVCKETRQLIGYGGLRAFGGNAELVYLLDKPYWGRGLATEVALVCLKFGFEERGFDQIIALCKPGNIASRRVLEKIGMHYRSTVGYFSLMAHVGKQNPNEDDSSNAGEDENSADIEVAQYSMLRTSLPIR